MLFVIHSGMLSAYHEPILSVAKPPLEPHLPHREHRLDLLRATVHGLWVSSRPAKNSPIRRATCDLKIRWPQGRGSSSLPPILDNAHHLSNVDQPDAFNVAVLQFLARH
jgi:hypothetical protein